MITARQYYAPYKRFDGNKLQPTLLTSSLKLLVVGEAANLVVTGYNFDSESVAFIWKDSELKDNAIVIDGIYHTPNQVKIPFTVTDEANYIIKVVNGVNESNELSIRAIAPVTESTSSEELINNNIIRLNDLSNLAVGNNPDVKATLDLLYYKTVAPKVNGNGIYITKKGYLVFPRLVLNKSEEKTINFVFYCGNDTSFLVFGYCSEENYNFASNDYNKAEYCARLRNQYGAYYQHGLFASGRSSSTFNGYTDYDRENYYKISVPVGGDKVKFYKLDDGDIGNWFRGTLQQSWQMTSAPDFTGETLYPFFGNYNSSKSPILGVFLS